MKILTVIGCLSLIISGIANMDTYAGEYMAPDASMEQRVYDMADLFEEEQEAYLEDVIADYRSQYELDLVVVTTEDAQGKTGQLYGDDFYEEGGFGYGSGKDGILYLIDMDNRELVLSTDGKAVRVFTDVRIEEILDDVFEYASEGDFAASAQVFLSDAVTYWEKGIPSDQHNYDTETGRISAYKSIRWYEALFAFGVAFFVAGSACLTVKRSYRMEDDRQRIAGLNMAYRADSRFAYNDKTDQLINKFVTSRMIPRNVSGGGSGGRSRGSSSGRSSTHRSSSGRSHGGGSRKF